MTHRSYADELEAAASDIGDMSIPALQTLLRRAALRLRNRDALVLDEDVEAALSVIMDEMRRPRDEVLRIIVLDWFVSYGRLPMTDLNADGGGVTQEGQAGELGR